MSMQVPGQGRAGKANLSELLGQQGIFFKGNVALRKIFVGGITQSANEFTTQTSVITVKDPSGGGDDGIRFIMKFLEHVCPYPNLQ